MMYSSLKLSSSTPLSKQSLKKLNIIIQSLFNNTDSLEFRTPVDWKGFGLTDYPLIIKHPMDLSTVKKKLSIEKYKSVESVLDDIQLIWDNCKTYNDSTSWIHTLAVKLEKPFRKMIKNYFGDIKVQQLAEGSKGQGQGEVEQGQQEVTYEDRQKFSQRLRLLGSKELGEIVGLIKKESPEAWKVKGEDRAHLTIDDIGNKLFHELVMKLDVMLEGRE